ncbi:MAG: cytochrome c [Chloroflexi bacterium]|nr:cytochrome c [Chloroflexota bacterium]MCX6911810.1 cytochrome c [Verrucomicrobiota bacterium]
MKAYLKFAVLLLLAGLGFSACQTLPVPASAPATSITPTSTPANTAPATVISIPNPDHGQAAWQAAQCMACHGPLALGGVGPQLAATKLSYAEFLHTTRTASPHKPAYDEAALPDQSTYDIYAWVRTLVSQAQVVSSSVVTPTSQLPQVQEMMAMTIWTCKKCSTCHGVFAQGNASGPALAGLNDPLAQELTQMRSTAATINEHSADNIADDIFARLYEWLKRGCLPGECSQ